MLTSVSCAFLCLALADAVLLERINDQSQELQSPLALSLTSLVAAAKPDDLLGLKSASAVFVFGVSIASAFSVSWLASLAPFWVDCCQAAAGGVMMSVGMSHMVPESLESLEAIGVEWASYVRGAGKQMHDVYGIGGFHAPHPGHDHGHEHDHGHDHGGAAAAAAGHDHGGGGGHHNHSHGDSFPVGYMLTFTGYFFTVLVLTLSHDHSECHGHDANDTVKALEHTDGHRHGPHDEHGSHSSSSKSPTDAAVAPAAVKKNLLVAFSLLIGLSFHNIIESLAVGSYEGDEMGYILLVASVLAHKIFEVPIIFSKLYTGVSTYEWWMGVILYSLLMPVGFLVGAVVMIDLPEVGGAAFAAFAGGSLIAIAVNDLIGGSLMRGTQSEKATKIFAACFSALFMAVLPTLLS